MLEWNRARPLGPGRRVLLALMLLTPRVPGAEEHPSTELPGGFALSGASRFAQAELLGELDAKEQLALWRGLIDRFGIERQKAHLENSFYDPELTYAGSYVQLRELLYGPLRNKERTLAYLRLQASDPRDDSYASLIAALYLADRPQVQDLEAILQGYNALTSESSTRVSYARQLGRAVQALRAERGDDEPVVHAALSQLRADARSDSAWTQGAAFEGLYRAGFRDEAVACLRDVLDGDLDARDRLRTLEAAARLLALDGVDPGMLARATDLAVATAGEVMETATLDESLMSRVSREAKLLQAALGFLEDAATIEHLDFIIECYTDPRAPVLLGITGLQGQRLNLERLRRFADADQRRRIDSIFFQALVEAGERLFHLEEDPMDEEERTRFESERDFRYNAASYISTEWANHEDLQQAWLAQPDATEFLALICLSDRDESEGEAGNRLFYGVREKMETRVQCAQILAMMQKHVSWEIVEPDLGPFFVTIAAREFSAPIQPTVEAFEILTENQNEYLVAEIPIVRQPDDPFVKDQALIGLVEMGFSVYITAEAIRVRHSVPPGM